MSIVASVKVYDGIALGADSITQLIGEDAKGQFAVMKTYSHARKLFRLSQSIGLLTYGVGNIGKRSIESYVIEFEGKLRSEDAQLLNVKNIGKSLFEHFHSIYNSEYTNVPETKWPVLGVYVAGYSENNPMAEEWEFVVPKTELRLVREHNKFGASWRGISIPFTRLYTGFDPRVADILKAQGLAEEIITKVKNVAEELKSQIVFDGMPLQDAVHFCKFILATTVGMAAFEVGPASCGGWLDLAVITRKDGFTWVSQKQLQP
jgi:hypothetical protein